MAMTLLTGLPRYSTSTEVGTAMVLWFMDMPSMPSICVNADGSISTGQ